MVRVPSSTYRLQLNPEFGFRAASAVVDYLAALGIHDCYVSPLFKAVPGSSHGYDVCDHRQLNPELGSDDDFAQYVSALHHHTMGQVVDFVPNHMAVEAANNPWWRDVLANGPASPFASFFDIDWEPAKPELHGKVLLPILEDHYGRELAKGRFKLAVNDGDFQLQYGSHTLPLNPRTTPPLLEADIDALGSVLGEAHADVLELRSIATSLRNLPPEDETVAERRLERHREHEVARDRLRRLCERAPDIQAHLRQTLEGYNAPERAPTTLHELLEEQAYRLAHWRTAADEINYRRFFDINHLAGLRMQENEVFQYAHSLLFRLIADGAVTGVRLDHIDGLFDPTGYLQRLQAEVAPLTERTNGAGESSPIYCVVEKILSRGETLPRSWPVAGTTGYEFLNQLNGLFVDGSSQRKLLTVYRRFTAQRQSFRDLVHETKRFIIDGPMASELNMLAHALNRLSEADSRTRDFTLNGLRYALREIIACLPVYRVYFTPEGISAEDRARVESAVRAARWRNPTLEPSIFDFVRDALVGAGESDAWRDLSRKLQQYTGPVQAKGVEDTAFYRYLPLISANEVGGDPDRSFVSVDEFHRANVDRRAHWPHGLLASTTHDTKRSEDVRARINVLSELPDEWGRQLGLWARINSPHRTIIDGRRVPDRNAEYLFYQTLIGIWPVGSHSAGVDDELVDRVREYLLKAAREAKVHTDWIYPDARYEAGLTRFAELALRGPTAERFLDSFRPFQDEIARWGMLNGLSQLVLKIASPGVPDFYQGTELWTLTLVDPDNRRPVDFALRARLLAEVEPIDALTGEARIDALRGLLEAWPDGRIKLYVTRAGLRCRRQQSPLFLDGDYTGLAVHGARRDHVVAFARRADGRTLITVVPRLVARLSDFGTAWPLGEAWADTRIVLPAGVSVTEFRNVLTGAVVAVDQNDENSLAAADVLRHWPVALLLAAAA